MPQLELPVSAGVLPSGFCPTSYQDTLNTYAQYLSVTFPSTFTGITVSATKPADSTQAWQQLDSFGRPTRLYNFAQGAWLSLHPEIPGMTKIWTGALPDFTTFDGGDANALSPISGPMWKVVLQQTFIVGAGTLASGTVLNIGDTGGEETHKLIATEMPPHVHPLTGLKNDNMSRNDLNILVYPGNNAPFGGDANANAIPNTGSTGGDPATGTPPSASVGHNTMPPYTVVTFLQRTTRLFYTVN